MLFHVHQDSVPPRRQAGLEEFEDADEDEVIIPEAEVATVIATVPEFADRYLQLVEQWDGDPGAEAVFGDLADIVTELARGSGGLHPVLARVLTAVELVALTSPDAEELVAWSFLDAISPDALQRLEPWLGAHTRALLRQLDGS
jgi:hypothetical protein